MMFFREFLGLFFVTDEKTFTKQYFFFFAVLAVGEAFSYLPRRNC